MKKFLLGALSVSALALMAAGLYTNGLVGLVPGSAYTIVTSSSRVPLDTNLAGGAAPQTVGVSPFQLGMIQSELLANTATSTAGAATLNVRGGVVTTEALTTAPGATYTFTLTDSVIAAAAPATLQVGLYSKSNTAAANMQVTSVTQSAGSAVIVFTNVGTVALNGTMLLPFHV